jgi:hypothetical protein
METTEFMAKKSRATFQKREKEKQRQQRQRDKEAQRLAAKERRANADPTPDGIDPDLIGIVPGPQPLPEQWRHADELETGVDEPFDDAP